MSSIAGHPRWPGTVRYPLKHPNSALAGDPALAPVAPEGGVAAGRSMVNGGPGRDLSDWACSWTGRCEAGRANH